VIHGRVQGVFFRDSMRREAQRLGIAGWVRNRNDGTVEAAVQGRVRRRGHYRGDGRIAARIVHTLSASKSSRMLETTATLKSSADHENASLSPDRPTHRMKPHWSWHSVGMR